jgi:glycosyltransferase involved in cell wall biosynthesis
VARLRRLAGDDPRVQLRGRFERHQLSAVLAQIDLLVVPSIWYEGAPFVILEAFAHQIPVIATRLGSLPELVRDEVDGLLFTRGDAADLARQLQRLIDDEALYRRLRTGIGPVRTYRDETQELFALFEQTIRSSEVAAGDGR